MNMGARLFRSRVSGFTMLELMLVVAVIAVIAAFAFPGYQEFVRKSRRTQVKSDLQEIQQNMERQFTMQNTYAGFPLGPFVTSPRNNPPVAFYRVRFSAGPTATTYTLQATPVGPQVGDRCGIYTINQAGVKTANENDCW